ncbi:putative ABC transporter permease/ATP-binding protein [Tetragenococcus halophilus subsp. halophilus]|uniref:ABC transporter permease/ATP-binding protein n=1 Tax=Tetragenococcus halophilus (strain DSM 20338 / JCM 20259 / NCIMB 9735 / NBRC 12172) TaxID=945021 RepID=A0AAN1SFN7_TETHN|nr:ABC transporter ATP-binding protein [Tetragenococcus halophilus]NWO01041.1 ABC transporter ATP-binding protein [Tetragenococcus halophilus]RQD29446.1 ABC transporter ATP-binding protein [Tetragenococcus halophilus subsp. halophilus DSM 20339]WJS81578.1 ABC transporter ATP-binding protein [Tetragenococcus halophilus]BAK93912.1 putative ABC transporter permease/ATP-binding protein [Tetragenococcus halophilus NBRC 12172]GBD58274.1 putative ABC transporter permease/ATP-binding protein [Tetragen
MSVFKDFKRYKFLVLIVLILTFANTIGELLLPKMMSQIIDIGVTDQNISYILRLGTLMIGVTLITILVRASAAYFSAKTSMLFSRDLRKRMFNKVNRMTFDETEYFSISSLITRTTNDIAQIEQLVLMGLRPLARAPLTFIGGLFMAFTTSVRLSMIVFVSLPFLAVVLYFVIKVVVPYFPRLQKALDHINLLLRQRLTGLKVIRAFSRDKQEEESFEDANDKYYQIGLKVNKVMQTINPILTLILNLSIVATLLLGVRFVQQGTLSIGALMAFVQYITQVLNAVIMVTRMMTMLPRSVASIDRVNAVLNYPSRSVGGSNVLNEPITSVKAQDLTFYYPDANLPALENLNFSVYKGEVMGIIGGTGSGKSTLLKLFMQFYDPSEGKLLINDQAIDTLNPESVREKISYVPQQNYFFSDSVRGNLFYSNPDASDEKMLDSLETAQAMQFLPKEEPLEKTVARGGRNYSGGQRQRLAISRALTRPASLYVFDDSFSALDYKTDHELRLALQGKLNDAATIIVAQRVATIRHANKILVLENGKVQGLGSHDELMQSNQIYREIAISQGEEEDV